MPPSRSSRTAVARDNPEEREAATQDNAHIGLQAQVMHAFGVWRGELHDFCNQWALVWRSDGQLAAAWFALTSFSRNRRARLALRLPSEPLDVAQIRKQYDIDSIRGAIFIWDPWPFEGMLQVYSIPPPYETMKGKSKYYLTLGGRDVSYRHKKPTPCGQNH